jgi:hypothetical protein
LKAPWAAKHQRHEPSNQIHGLIATAAGKLAERGPGQFLADPAADILYESDHTLNGIVISRYLLAPDSVSPNCDDSTEDGHKSFLWAHKIGASTAGPSGGELSKPTEPTAICAFQLGNLSKRRTRK